MIVFVTYEDAFAGTTHAMVAIVLLQTGEASLH